MAIFHKDNYKPFKSVSKRLKKENSNMRLVSLWNKIGKRVLCINEPGQPKMNYKALHEMFSTDVIAYDLMQAILLYSIGADKIIVSQYFANNANAIMKDRSFTGINAEVIGDTNKSKFIAVVFQEEENIVRVKFWSDPDYWEN